MERERSYTRHEKTRLCFATLLALGGIALGACANNESPQSYNSNPAITTTTAHNPNNSPPARGSSTESPKTTSATQNQVPLINPEALLKKGGCKDLGPAVINLIETLIGNVGGSNTIQCSVVGQELQVNDNFAQSGPNGGMNILALDNIDQGGRFGFQAGTNIWNAFINYAESHPNSEKIIDNYQNTGVNVIYFKSLNEFAFLYQGYIINGAFNGFGYDYASANINNPNFQPLASLIVDILNYVNQNDK